MLALRTSGIVDAGKKRRVRGNVKKSNILWMLGRAGVVLGCFLQGMGGRVQPQMVVRKILSTKGLAARSGEVFWQDPDTSLLGITVLCKILKGSDLRRLDMATSGRWRETPST
jgi:hypothetical protein